MPKYKLLIINGGGIFGCIPAHFLGMLPIGSNLDKINGLAGCSVGGILAAAYASGRHFIETDRRFQSSVDDCFTRRWQSYINLLAVPKYRGDTIESVIREMVGNKTLGDVRNLDVVIPALNITDDKLKVFDNITGDDASAKLLDIALMTSAAPTYFPSREYNGKCMIDAGLIEVAPLVTAATAIKSKKGIPFADMDVLMLGTGKDVSRDVLTRERYDSLTLLGIATDLIVPYATLGNQLATVFWGENMGFNKFTYWNPITTDGNLDDASQVPDLIWECEKYRMQFIEVWNEFCSL